MGDLKRLLGYLGPYRRDMALGALLVLVESAFELFIPVLMSDIIDVGVANRDVVFILHKGVQMGICAILALATACCMPGSPPGRPTAGEPASGRPSLRGCRLRLLQPGPL